MPLALESLSMRAQRLECIAEDGDQCLIRHPVEFQPGPEDVRPICGLSDKIVATGVRQRTMKNPFGSGTTLLKHNPLLALRILPYVRAPRHNHG